MSAAPDGGRSETAAAQEEALGAFSHQLAEALGRPADLPRETAERAAVDPLYLHGLTSRRDAPDAVSWLVAQPSGTSLPKWAPRPTPVLLAKAARALLRWVAAGFGQVIRFPEDSFRKSYHEPARRLSEAEIRIAKAIRQDRLKQSIGFRMSPEVAER